MKDKKAVANRIKKTVRRPMNSFFYYRRDMRERFIRIAGTSKSHAVSKIAGEHWANESEDVKQYYKSIALAANKEHKIQHPDFEWRSPSKNKVQKQKNSNPKKTSIKADIKETLNEQGSFSISADDLLKEFIDDSWLSSAASPTMSENYMEICSSGPSSTISILENINCVSNFGDVDILTAEYKWPNHSKVSPDIYQILAF